MSDDDDERVRAGATLGRYELLAPIAQGGMAIVWAARLKGTRGFQKIFAVKSMLPALSSDEQFEEMFLAEAGLAARIRHPNVCEILDLGEDDGNLYIVMEWVDGEAVSSLHKAARRQKRRMPFSVSARVIKDAAYGLHAAHELKDDAGELVGLVHRDVSPQNILVTYDGVVKIVDFGVAKAKGLADGLTRTGQIKGKVPFMAPEQVHGKQLDRRADIFGLGIVLYQLITGKHPFRAEGDVATMNAILTDNPPLPSVFAPDCPRELETAVMQALQKDREERYQTMAELARALEQAIGKMTAAGDTTDPGVFVREVLGERGDKRRATIKEAIRASEERERRKGEGGPESNRSRSDLMGASGVSMLTIPLAAELTPAPNSVVGVDGRMSSPPEALLYTPRQKRPRRMAVVGGLAIAGILGAVAIIMPRPWGATSGGPGAEALSPTTPSAESSSVESPVVPAATAAPSASAPAEPTGSAATSAAPAASAAPTAEPSATAASRPPRWHPRSKPTAKPPTRSGVPKIRTPGF